MRVLKFVAVMTLWAAPAIFVVGDAGNAQTSSTPEVPGNVAALHATEAPAGFDGESNGFAEEFCARQDELVNSPNSPKIPADECGLAEAEEEFTGPETVADGVGPIFNATGCGECHTAGPGFDPNNFARKLVGGTSEITERRAGRFDGTVFTDHPGGSLIHNRSLRPSEQERVLPGHNVLALRSSLSTLGDGFVEAVANGTLEAIARQQPAAQRGQVIRVPVFEKPGTDRVGRFGHKGQQASLVSFSADAYVNEMGITSPLQPDEPTSNGTPVEDPVPGLDDEGVDVELFALFMRSTKVPPVDETIAATSEAQSGRQIFAAVGCAVCHTPTMVTAPPGTWINGGALKVTNALGNKIIHPFSDFLLHDVGTGDGIVQNGGPASRNKIRTPALWGVRTRGRLMHDQLSFSFEDAIRRHRNQADASRMNFNGLSAADKRKLLTFLSSL